MLGKTYESQNCSAARALEIVGERWSLLIIRDAVFRNARRFSDFERGLGIAPNILATRLETFLKHGLMERGKGAREGEYIVTEKGKSFAPVIVALTHWGDKWAAPQGPPVRFAHTACGGVIKQRLTCGTCDKPVSPDRIRGLPGPGARR